MPSPRPHLILIGGFLGAGKTSAMIVLADWLANQGLRSAFVTNDQGDDLVDTRLLRACGVAAEEIAGGCFCCRFDEFAGATRRLRDVMRPDVIVAEAVGSCTDLSATVAYPMHRLLGAECTIAPLSVIVDPVRARRAFGLDPGEQFSESVQYIYRKQLEEADLIVICKSDLLTARESRALRRALQRAFPAANILTFSARDRLGGDEWFRRILFDEQVGRSAMAMDYDRYADGESRLGWLNATAHARHPVAADGNVLLAAVAANLRERLMRLHVEVAHLKMALHPDVGGGVASINWVRNEVVAEAGMALQELVGAATLTINLRVEARPEILDQAVRESLGSVRGWTLELLRMSAFSPGRPVPTHRDSGLALKPPST